MVGYNVPCGAGPDPPQAHSTTTPLFSFSSERRKRSHGHRKNNKSKSTSDSISDTLQLMSDLYSSAKLKDLYIVLRSLSRPLIESCLESLSGVFKNQTAKRWTMYKIILAYRSQYIKPPKREEDVHVYCSIPFVHTAVEKM